MLDALIVGLPPVSGILSSVKLLWARFFIKLSVRSVPKSSLTLESLDPSELTERAEDRRL